MGHSVRQDISSVINDSADKLTWHYCFVQYISCIHQLLKRERSNDSFLLALYQFHRLPKLAIWTSHWNLPEIFKNTPHPKQLVNRLYMYSDVSTFSENTTFYL